MPATYSYTRSRVRRKGIKDGRNWYWKLWPLMKEQKAPYPTVEQDEPASFETELAGMAEASITDLSKQWEKEDRKLFSDYCRKLSKRNGLNKEDSKESKELEEARMAMVKAKKDLDDIEEPAIPHAVEVALIIIFFAVELPFNSIIFSIFGASKAETIIMATGTALAISTLAYVFGKKLKMHPKTLKDHLLLAIIPLAAIGALAAVSFLRSVLFGAMQQAAILKIDLDPDTAALIFVVINFGLFVASMIVTYLATRPDHTKYRTLFKKFQDAKAEYKRALKDAEEASEDLAEAEEALIHAQHKRAKTFEIYCEEAVNLADDVEWLIRVYRTANMEARLDSRKPACFRNPPGKIQVPENLAAGSIAWDCNLMERSMSQTFSNSNIQNI
jgi:hypothetical protein